MKQMLKKILCFAIIASVVLSTRWSGVYADERFEKKDSDIADDKNLSKDNLSLGITLDKDTVKIGESLKVTVSMPSGYFGTVVVSSSDEEILIIDGDSIANIGDASGYPTSQSFQLSTKKAGKCTINAYCTVVGDEEGNDAGGIISGNSVDVCVMPSDIPEKDSDIEEAHIYGEPEVKWSDDCSSVKAIWTCKNCSEQTTTEGKIYSYISEEPTCTKQGITTYVAMFNFNMGIYTCTNELKNIPVDPKKHSGNLSIKNDIPVSFTKEGYTGDVCCADCNEILLKGEDIPKLSHKYGEPQVTWADDGKSAKFTFSCSDENSPHTDVFDADITSNIKIEPTCVDMGTTTYTASYAGYKFTKDVKDIPINPDNHVGDTETKNVKAATCSEEGYTGDTCCKSCGKIIYTGRATDKTPHDFENPVLKWDENGSAMVVETCKNNINHTQTSYVAVTTTLTPSTCSVHGSLKKEASYDGQTISQVEELPFNPNKHTGGTEIRNAKSATYDKDGYTGDIYCKSCGAIVTNGQVLPKLEKKEFWNDICNQIEKSAKGKNIDATVEDTTIIPKEILEVLKGKDVNLVVGYKNGNQWMINGKNITSIADNGLNLGIIMNTDAIPEDLIASISNKQKTVQFCLNHNGKFGLDAILTLNLMSENAGKEADLYYYNKDAGKLEFMQKSIIGINGMTDFNFSHASDYVVVIQNQNTSNKDVLYNPATTPTDKKGDSSPKPKTISSINTDKNIKAATSAKNTVNNNAQKQASVKTGDATNSFVFIFILVLGITLEIAYLFRKKENNL